MQNHYSFNTTARKVKDGKSQNCSQIDQKLISEGMPNVRSTKGIDWEYLCVWFPNKTDMDLSECQIVRLFLDVRKTGLT